MIRRATKTDALLAHIRGLGTDKYGAPVGIRTTALAEATGVGANSIQALLDRAVLRGDLVVCQITGPTGRIEREYRAGPGVPPPAFVPLNTRRAGIAHGPATKPLPVTTPAAGLSTPAPAANAAPAVPVFLDQQREKPQPAVGNTGQQAGQANSLGARACRCSHTAEAGTGTAGNRSRAGHGFGGQRERPAAAVDQPGRRAASGLRRRPGAVGIPPASGAGAGRFSARDAGGVAAMTKYRNHNSLAVLKSNHYMAHACAMTSEALHGKSEIAEELAARDIEIDALRAFAQAVMANWPEGGLDGGDPAYAGVFHKDCAERAAATLRKKWLHPHVAVELEPVPHNDRVEGRDAASSRRVPSHDGLEGK